MPTDRTLILARALPLLLLLVLLGAGGCARPAAPGAAADPDPIASLLEEELRGAAKPLAAMGYAIQVGAFANLDNAVRLEEQLKQRGLDAWYFRHASGLYKVQFGNHRDYAGARFEAEQLQRQGLIDDYFIVIPEAYAAARIRGSGQGDLRAELVSTAKRFLGVPYRWGGSDHENGFDCSGLTMVSYRLNGLDLPRNSRSQFAAGRWVTRAQLQPGDLVFFATQGGKRVTHVGMYIGEDRFIHAPRTGQTVRIERLSSPFFARTYMGGRTYL